MSAIKSIKGFADMFPPESDAFTHMEKTARSVFFRCGYVELRTPLLERTELFCRSIGTETDVVQKEMYTFHDRKDRSLTLRPEATAGVMRAYLEAGRHTREPVSKLFTCGPMFRYERPQKGRMRQFHQINCECIGAKGPHTDAEIIVMLMSFLQELGIRDLELHLNSLGCPQCRPAYRALLHDYLKSLDVSALCEDCRRRMETNPLRVLDCKVPTCREHTERAPKITDHLCPECGEHFDVVRRLLRGAGIVPTPDHRLVRGLDYYCRTTFEVVSGGIGAQSSVAGGGRYDGLIRQLGGPDLPGIGFACGMERLALLLPPLETARPDFHIVVMEAAALEAAFLLASSLRDRGFSGDMCHSGGGFKSQMRQADKSGARNCLILGPEEMASGTVVVKDMDSGRQTTVRRDEAAALLGDRGQAERRCC